MLLPCCRPWRKDVWHAGSCWCGCSSTLSPAVDEQTFHARRDLEQGYRTSPDPYISQWDGNADSETAVKSETKATIRCIFLDEKIKDKNCIYSGNPAKHEVIFARAY